MNPDWKWLESTNRLQRYTYEYDFPWLDGLEFGDEYTATDEETRYYDWNVTAAVQELAEARQEFSWKPWATDPPFVNRERLLAEMVDVCHFIGNILIGLGVTDEEWAAAYQVKQEKNRRRVASGNYSAKKGGLGEGSDNE